MSRTLYPPTHQIKELFAEEIAAVGGTVSEVFHDGRRLFARSILPGAREVRPRDRVQGGVALRTLDTVVCVHPYVFRQVCRNGAIMAQAVQTTRIERVDCEDPDAVAGVVFQLREAVLACIDPEAFTASVSTMRSASEMQADMMLNLLSMVSRLPNHQGARIMVEIMDAFEKERDPSAFGLMNAVTAVARETRDPETRWRLEELGGGIAARLPLSPLPDDAGAELALRA